MMIETYEQSIQFTVLGPVIPVGENDTATVQAVKKSAVWGTAVLTVKRSNDGKTFHALESAVTLGPGDAMSAAFSVAGFAFLRVDVTTAEGSAEYIDVTVCLKRTGNPPA